MPQFGPGAAPRQLDHAAMKNQNRGSREQADTSSEERNGT